MVHLGAQVPCERQPWARPRWERWTGQRARAARSGSSPGNFDAGTYTRTVTVPAGKALFFPLLNNAYFGYASDPPMSDADIDGWLAYLASTVVGQPVTCEIDGVPVVAPELIHRPDREGPPVHGRGAS